MTAPGGASTEDRESEPGATSFRSSRSGASERSRAVGADGGGAAAAGLGTGLYLYGIMRTGTRRPRGRADGGGQLLYVRSGDLEALVRHVAFAVPPLEPDRVAEHQHTVEHAMRRATILPAPYGVVFRGRRALLRFLQDQHLVLDEALAFVEGHWELRLHIGPAHPEASDRVEELAAKLYAELRRFARAAVPCPREDRDGLVFLSAAFLVERTGWIEFIERAHDLAAAHPELSCDITGPWPPYDFVRMAV